MHGVAAGRVRNTTPLTQTLILTLRKVSFSSTSSALKTSKSSLGLGLGLGLGLRG